METSEAILLIRTVKGIESLLTKAIKLGVDVSAAVGPTGAGIEGAASIGPPSINGGKDFLTYARTKGAYVGISIEGATIRTRDDLNKAYYSASVRPSDIALIQKVKPNPLSQELHQLVAKGAGENGQ